MITIRKLLATRSTLKEDVKSKGKIFGDTKEFPMGLRFSILPRNIGRLIDAIDKYIPANIKELEKDEYDAMLKATKETCTEEFARDTLGRRAVVLHHGCITYQHFTLRDRALIYSVHCRGMDIEKFMSDIQFILIAARVVICMCLPEGVKVSEVMVNLQVDCFHCYIKEAKKS